MDGAGNNRDSITDMLDYRHRRVRIRADPPTTGPVRTRFATLGWRSEYYEIKPMSPQGINAARAEKVPKIDRFIATFHLPYVAGIKYLPVAPRQKEILTNNPLFTPLRQILLTMFNLASIRVFLVWEKPAPALIVYMVMIVVETSDNRTLQPSAWRDLAQYVVQLIIQLLVPGTNLVVPPVGKITVELPEEVAEFKAAVEGSAGGLVFDAVPGETHVLVIDESGFQAIIEKQRNLPVFLRSTGVMFNTEEWRRVLRQAALDKARPATGPS